MGVPTVLRCRADVSMALEDLRSGGEDVVVHIEDHEITLDALDSELLELCQNERGVRSWAKVWLIRRVPTFPGIGSPSTS